MSDPMSDVIQSIWYETSTSWHANVWESMHSQVKRETCHWQEKGIPFGMVSGNASYQVRDAVRNSVRQTVLIALSGQYGSVEGE